MSNGKNRSKKGVVSLLLVGGCLIFYLAVQLKLAWDHSVTSDEPVHMLSGYVALTQNKHTLDPEHPFLVKKMAALPLLFLDLKDPEGLDEVIRKSENFFYDVRREALDKAEKWLHESGNNQEQMVYMSRLPMIGIGLILMLSIYLIARYYFGSLAGLTALLLAIAEPNLMAHANLVNTDVPVALFFLWAVFFWVEYLRKVTDSKDIDTRGQNPPFAFLYYKGKHTKWLLGVGIFLGLANLTKFSAISLIPVFFILALVRLTRTYGLGPKNIVRRLLELLWPVLITVLISFVIIWLGYGAPLAFDQTMLDHSHDNEHYWMNEGAFLQYFAVPPQFFKGLWLLQRDIFQGRIAFLLGKTNPGGWWYYFPLAFIFKTPISLFIFSVWGFINACRQKFKNLAWEKLAFSISIMILFLLAMIGKMNIGLRHIFTVYPFLIILISSLIAQKVIVMNWERVRLAAGAKRAESKKVLIDMSAIALLFVFYFGSVWVAFPRVFSYFNEFVGQENGWKILGDSNMDWGQEVKVLSDYLRENQIEHPYCSYYWSHGQFDYFGIDCQYVSQPDQMQEGIFIADSMKLQDPDYQWIFDLHLKERVGDTFFIYKI